VVRCDALAFGFEGTSEVPAVTEKRPPRKRREKTNPTSSSRPKGAGERFKYLVMDRRDFRHPEGSPDRLEARDSREIYRPEQVVEWLEGHIDSELIAENQYGDMVIVISGWRPATPHEVESFDVHLVDMAKQDRIWHDQKLDDARRLLREAGEL
jgi:hypothetical protein